jgi:hypothetical protein
LDLSLHGPTDGSTRQNYILIRETCQKLRGAQEFISERGKILVDFVTEKTTDSMFNASEPSNARLIDLI